MRGVLCARTDARLVDVAHDFPRQDVRTAAFWLREVLPYFPPAVHLAVVDPGVGTGRAALVVRAGDHALVGPDNGLLLPAARALAESPEIYEWRFADAESHTFHGRDVFAPAAATVHEALAAAGWPDATDTDDEPIAALDETRRTESFEDLRFPTAEVRENGATGEVLVVDGFGNAVTNVPGGVLEGQYGDAVAVNGESVPVVRSYAQVDSGTRLVTVGSHGNVELAANRGRGDRLFGAQAGDGVELLW